MWMGTRLEILWTVVTYHWHLVWWYQIQKHKECQLIYIYRRAKWTHFSWTYLLHCSKKILKQCTLGFEIKCVGRIFGKSWNLILHLISYRRCHCCRLPYRCLWQRYTSAETEESNVKYRKAFSRIHVVSTF